MMLSSIHAYRLAGYTLRPASRRMLSDMASAHAPSAAGPSVFTSVSFFRFAEIKDADVDSIISLAKQNFQEKGIKGTLLLSNEGYNGQFALPEGTVSSFCADLAAINHALFSDIDINVGKTIDYNATPMPFPFKKLIVRRKKGALTDGLSEEVAQSIDWTQPGPEMPPNEWHKTVTCVDKDAPVVLLGQMTRFLLQCSANSFTYRFRRTFNIDCRNNYESDVGLFEGATPLNTTYFRETWDKLHEVLQGVEKDAKILTYCTGGIRCVKVKFLFCVQSVTRKKD